MSRAARVAVALLATAAGSAAGQAGAAGAAGAGLAPDSAQLAARARLWIRPVASLAVPGTGQLLAHEDRGALYLVTELYLVTRYFQLRHDAQVQADRFRELAFEVARRPFAPSRRDTIFEYFETMERFVASGQFDYDPGPGISPETDPATYNGSVWLLARRTNWSDPDTPPPPTSLEYIRAIDFYIARAVGPGFQWSWRDAPLARDEFRATIRNSDDGFRRAQNQLGLLLANHLVSAVDALASSRLSGVARRPAQLETVILGPHHGRVALRVAL